MMKHREYTPEDGGGRCTISPNFFYRYTLERWWIPDPRRWVLWVMLNPSTATAHTNDPTIGRCVAFSKAWGYDGLLVGNMFAYRATDPAQLRVACDPVGPDNQAWLQWMAARAELVVCAWGTRGPVTPRMCRDMMLDTGRVPAKCLGLTKNGMPKHPLYLAADTHLTDYMPA